MAYCPHCNKNVTIVTTTESDQNREINTVNVYSKGDYDSVRHKIGEYENEQVYVTTTTVPRCSLCFREIDYPEVQSKEELDRILKRKYRIKIIDNVDSCKHELLTLQQSKKKIKSKFKTNFSFGMLMMALIGLIAAYLFIHLAFETDNAFLASVYSLLILFFGGFGLLGLFFIYSNKIQLNELKFNEDIENKIKLKQKELVEKQQELDKILEEEDKEKKRDFDFMLTLYVNLQPDVDRRLSNINDKKERITRLQTEKKEIKSKFNSNFKKFEFFTSLFCFSFLAYLIYYFTEINDDILASIICVLIIIILGIIGFAGIFTMYDKTSYEKEVKYNEDIENKIILEQQQIDIIQLEIDKIQQVLDKRQGLYR